MKRLLFLMHLFSAGFAGIAQKPAETKPYSGRLTDEQGNGVEYATATVITSWKQKPDHTR